MSEVLYLEKRGCDFFAGDPIATESDIGNYRVTTPDYTVYCPANGHHYFLEFHGCDRYQYRCLNKRTGAFLKRPVRELVMTSAMFVDACYQDKYGCTWNDIIFAHDVHHNPRKYTEQNILDWVNSWSDKHYDRIEYIHNYN